ncbi:PEGA domain-containing protein [Aurantivibrio plasticivorans]
MNQETTSSSTLPKQEYAPATQGQETPVDRELIQPASFTPLNQPQVFKSKRWQLHHWLIALALFSLAAIATFLFRAQTLSIHTIPNTTDSDIEVRLSRLLSFKIGDNYLLLPGETTVSVQATGYQPKQQNIVITKEGEQVLNIVLEKLPGTLQLIATNEKVHNPDTIKIMIDGKHRGALGEPIEDVAAGLRTLHIDSERYLPLTTEVNITGLGQLQKHSVRLQPAWANVRLTSEPNGAQIIVDGEVQGVTPSTVEILAGEREVQLKLEGYKLWSELLELNAGDQTNLEPVSLEKADGLVSVNSQPSGASITVAGQYFGLTPQDVSLKPGQTYTITLFKEGYQPSHQRVAIESSKKANINIALTANLGKLNIQANPKDALLYVDGRLMGRANQTLTLPAVQTQIKIEKDGYAAHTTSVIPRVNFAQTLNVKLKTVEEARWENIPSTIKTKIGQTLKLFNPEVTFTLGSSRREQGRRANEGFRSVTLNRPFYLGTHEVSNKDFRQFQIEHSSNHVKGNSLNGEAYPVVNITWQQAALFCNWLSEKADLPVFYRVENGEVVGYNAQSNGYRLPTEAEWAWAARFDNGIMLKYAWGERLAPSNKVTNIADRSAAPVAGYVVAEYDDGFVASAPVGSFQANSKGLYDLDGNVAEWMHDFYEVSAGLSLKDETDPLGPESGGYHVIRGPSWSHGTITMLRLSYRDYGVDARNDVGFRIARYVN